MVTAFLPTAGHHQDATAGEFADCNPTEHVWDESGLALRKMEDVDDLRQAILDKRAEIPAERLRRFNSLRPSDAYVRR